jgi:hypothetical protein
VTCIPLGIDTTLLELGRGGMENFSDPRGNNTASIGKYLSKTGTKLKEWLKASEGCYFGKLKLHEI